jgi:predicted metalloprotease
MRYDRDHQSPDIVDRRGQHTPGGSGLFWLLAMIVRSKFGWAGVILLVIGWFAYQALVTYADPQRAGQVPGERGGAPDEMKAFIGTVLDDAQATWTKEFEKSGKRYSRAKLVLFDDSTPSACGLGDAATGPFYCPGDEQVYIDLSFFRALSERLGAPGDFAQAYVVAHEIGHHVQNLLGTSDRVHRALRREREGATGLSVRLELQADCYAGVWAHATRERKLLHEGDIEEALAAAAAIGDDRLQKRARGVVQPESFTHGTSEQRSRWFRRGVEQGDPGACDTFAASSL